MGRGARMPTPKGRPSAQQAAQHARQQQQAQ